MSTRSLASLSLFRSRAEKPRASTCAWLVLLLCVMGCGWEPIARVVQPVQIIAGPARLVRKLDADGRFAWVTVGTGDGLRHHLVNVAERTHCALEPTYRPVSEPLRAPAQRGDDRPAFLMPVWRGDGEQSELFFSDDKCALRGPFGVVTRAPEQTELRSDGRGLSLAFGPGGELRVVDPWGGEQVVIARDVSVQTGVHQPDGTTAPQALWLLEGGRLTQRALDGSLLLALGSAVDDFQQLLLDELRVVFHDGEDVFEAKGPDFTPVLIAEDACRAVYAGRALELQKPCAEEQLVRVDLTTGEVKTFTKGVYRAFAQGELSFELQNTPAGVEVYVARQNARIQLVPAPSNALSALDETHVAGRSADGRFGIWSLGQPFAVAYSAVQQVDTFRDLRTQRLLWLILHDVVDDIGTLSLFDQTDLERVKNNLPAGEPIELSSQVRAGTYSVLRGGSLPEPVILSLESPIRVLGETTVAGTLYARLLYGSLGSRIDDDVSSYDLVSAPLPGILYGIQDGPSSGLWFAAL